MDKITLQGLADDGKEHSMVVNVADLSKVFDGYHTIAELYDHRITLFIVLCKMMDRYSDNWEPCWRSKFHSDGSVIHDWFLLGVNQREGEQITYHIPMTRWRDTDFAKTLERAPKFDGHTSADVLTRLKLL